MNENNVRTIRSALSAGQWHLVILNEAAGWTAEKSSHWRAYGIIWILKLLILIGIGFGLYRTKEASGIQKQVVAGRNLKDADGLTGNRTGSRRLAVAR